MEETIRQDLKAAMLAKNELAVSTLRLLISEINNLKISKGTNLADSDIISVVQKEVKKRTEAEAGFRSGGKIEAAAKEAQESEILKNYLPSQLPDEELTKLIDEAIVNTGAKSIPDMGRVIGQVMAKVAGQADSSRVSSLVKAKLTNG